jgi:translation initiation factor IF-3
VRINGAISAQELSVIGQDCNQLGVLSRAEALLEAEKAGLDLVEVSPQAHPPVARIVDWGKYIYQKTKEQQRSRRNTKVTKLKQMRLGLKIGANELDIKLRKVKEFLGEGHKVKIMVFYRGREMAHQEIGYALMDQIIEKLQETAIVEQRPIMAGKTLGIVVRSIVNAKDQNPQGNSEES